ncbi:hypothetical protein [Pseudonocardia sp.]|uniref:hypothetical protein n=1 Tax=Pseudonocardia sp. TaxID=60912 RepID=UPI0025E719DC|nr:hypothetical protein [Pseudonocardia sp.]
MEVTKEDVERIPLRNRRVPLDEFVAVWAEAERRDAEQAERGVTDWYAGGRDRDVPVDDACGGAAGVGAAADSPASGVPSR